MRPFPQSPRHETSYILSLYIKEGFKTVEAGLKRCAHTYKRCGRSCQPGGIFLKFRLHGFTAITSTAGRSL